MADGGTGGAPSKRSFARRLLLALALATLAATSGGAPPADAVVPGTNGRIAFERDGAIWLMDGDGSDQTELAAPGPGEYGYRNPTFSPDQSKIAFDNQFNVYVMNADGSGVVNLTNETPQPPNSHNETYTPMASEPTFSPDGARIAYTVRGQADYMCQTVDYSVIFVMSADGSGQRGITDWPSDNPFPYYGAPSWSPDGADIAYSGSTRTTFHYQGGFGSGCIFPEVDRSDEHIFRVQPDDPHQTTDLTPDSTELDDPAYSPDGDRIAHDGPATLDVQLYTMNADGSNRAELGPNTGTELTEPAYSPDGTKLVFTESGDGTSGISEINADGTGRTVLTDDGSAPDWGAAVPLDTTIEGGAIGPTDDPTPTFHFHSSLPASTFECSLDGAAYASCASPDPLEQLSDGPHSFSVRAVDVHGSPDPTPASRSLTVDTVAPDTTIEGGPSDPTNDATPTFDFSSTEAGSTFECSLDSKSYGPCDTPDTVEQLGDGQHSFAVRATDDAGNTDPTPASLTFDVETGAPDTTIVGGPGDPTNDQAPTFDFSSTEQGSTFECSLDQAAYAACDSPDPLEQLADGPHSFAVRATDRAGNTDQTPATRTFTVDTAPPNTTIVGGPAGPTNDPTPSFDFSSSESGSTFECRVDGGPYSSCASPETLAILADGTHVFSVRATDPAGNTDDTPADGFFAVDTTVDGGASAKRVQKGSRPVVKIGLTAGEPLQAEVSGAIRVGKRSYRLEPAGSRPVTSAVSLKLSPQKASAGPQIVGALKRGGSASAKVVVELSDQLGNTRTTTLTVQLKP